MKRKILAPTLLALTCASLLGFTSYSLAGQLVKVPTVEGKALYYNQYSQGELSAGGCDSGVYTGMVNNYLQQRGAAHVSEQEIMVEQSARQAPSAGPMSLPGATGTQAQSCFSQAANQITNATKGLESILGIFSGGLDANALFESLAGSIMNGACQEINRVTGQAVGNVTGGINQAIGGVVQPVTGALGTNAIQIGNQGISAQQVINGANNNNTNLANNNMINGGGIGGAINNGNTGVQGIGGTQDKSLICKTLGFGC